VISAQEPPTMFAITFARYFSPSSFANTLKELNSFFDERQNC